MSGTLLPKQLITQTQLIGWEWLQSPVSPALSLQEDQKFKAIPSYGEFKAKRGEKTANYQMNTLVITQLGSPPLTTPNYLTDVLQNRSTNETVKAN